MKGSSESRGETVDCLRGISLGGFMGTGKSTVGRILAARLNLPFIDTDRVIEARFGPIPEQFRRDGEAEFRAREAAVLREITAGPPRVLATGGGAWVDPRNRAVLRGWGPIVVLTAPLEVLRARVKGAGRPLWDASVAARYEARAEAYRDADLTLDTSTRGPEAVAEEIEAWLT